MLFPFRFDHARSRFRTVDPDVPNAVASTEIVMGLPSASKKLCKADLRCIIEQRLRGSDSRFRNDG